MYFRQLTSFTLEFSPAVVTKWQLTRTGLQLTYVNQPLPMVQGYFAVATECVDDLGAPHTLEHLVFMGLEHHRYKGFLDTLGNQCYLTNNAWTATDQTVYTLTLAGWQGFNTMLPVYLDHLFRPTLTDAGCYTEVYHVDGTAVEKGVVFSEMQGVVNQLWSVLNLESVRRLFPASSGYSSETGGLLPSLRKLTADQIRAFHKSMYRPDNVCVVVSGSVDEAELLATMEQFDLTLPLLPEVPSKRPFVDSAPVPPLGASVVSEVQFPDEDESTGEALISWIGPDVHDTEANTAVDVIGKYLTDLALSFLKQELVECADPVALDVTYYTDDYINSVLNISISGVLCDVGVRAVAERAVALVQQHVDALDYQRLAEVAPQQKLKVEFDAERLAEILTTVAIDEFLYGRTGGEDLAEWAGLLKDYDTVALWSEAQWRACYQQYFVDNKYVCVVAVPLAELYNTSTAEEKAALDERKERYGRTGLAELADRLKRYTAENDLEIPDLLLAKYPKPDPAKIPLISTVLVRGGTNHTADRAYDAGAELAVGVHVAGACDMFVHYGHYQLRFVTLRAVFGAGVVEQRLLPYLALLELMVFELPVVDGSSRMLYQEAIAQLKKDTVRTRFLVPGSGLKESVSVSVTVSTANFAVGVQWLRRALLQSEFTKERVQSAVDKWLMQLPDSKRDGSSMLESAVLRHSFVAKSVRYATDKLTLEPWIEEMEDRVRNEWDEVLSDLEEVRRQLFARDNVRFLVLGNSKELAHPAAVLNAFAAALPGASGDAVPVPRGSAVHRPWKEVAGQAHVVLAPALDLTFVKLAAPIPSEWLHPDKAAIVVAAEVLQTLEGPFWRGIRGAGLAYGANTTVSEDAGVLLVDIYRGAKGEEALRVARDIINGYVDGSAALTLAEVERAAAVVVNLVVYGEDSAQQTAATVATNVVLKQLPADHTAQWLAAVGAVGVEDVLRVVGEYFVRLCDASQLVVFACCSPSKGDVVRDALASMGYAVDVEELNDESEEETPSESDE